MSTENKKHVEDSSSPEQRLEQIRDILFGETIQSIKSEIDALGRELQKIQNNYIEIKSEIDEQKDISQTNANSSFKEIKKVDATYKKIAKNLQDKIDTLNENKIDKNKIGEAFVEWGTKMKQE